MRENQKDNREKLAGRVKRFPAEPGVYLMKDKAGRVIYVGKARNLRSRVSSYFYGSAGKRQEIMVSRIEDIEYILTGTDIEALITESNLIKEYQPKYNVNLRDDKSYPYLKITSGEYPRLELVRLPEKKERQSDERTCSQPVYFGPYTEVRTVRQILKFLSKTFPLRSCRQPLDGRPRGRPCLNFQMERCMGPCRGKYEVSREDYQNLVNQVTQFINGRQNDLLKKIKMQMNEAAENMDFEKAAVYRDRLNYLQRLLDNQKILSIPPGDYDVLALICPEASTGDDNGHIREFLVYMYRVREGRLKEREHFALKGTLGLSEGEVMDGFIKNYYSRGVFQPAEIVVSHLPPEEELLQEWLRGLYRNKLKISRPVRGFRKELLERCLREGYIYAKEKSHREVKTEKAKEEEIRRAYRELEKLTGRKDINRIEGYDISHLRGGEAVGSMVVFQDGYLFRNGYRRFRIREHLNGDDCMAMEEVLERRLKHPGIPFPELIVADGGAAQLNVLIKVLELKGMDISVLALAKKNEEIYIPGEKEPAGLPDNSPSLGLLRRIRDEAHRFALAYHRKLREKDASGSSLDRIPGIGKKRKSEILRHFGGMDDLLKASPGEIAEVPGISRKLSRHIHDFLQRY